MAQRRRLPGRDNLDTVDLRIGLGENSVVEPLEILLRS
jgi:hypothetical protein